MQKFVSILACILCQLSVAYAQKCLAIFGVTEEVIEKPIEDARFTLYFNDSIQVPYTVISIDKQSNTYQFEFDYRPGKYTLRAEKEGYNEVQKDFTIASKRNTLLRPRHAVDEENQDKATERSRRSRHPYQDGDAR